MQTPCEMCGQNGLRSNSATSQLRDPGQVPSFSGLQFLYTEGVVMPAGFLSRSERAQPGAWDTVNTQRRLNPLLWGLLGKLSLTPTKDVLTLESFMTSSPFPEIWFLSCPVGRAPGLVWLVLCRCSLLSPLHPYRCGVQLGTPSLMPAPDTGIP